MATPSAPGTSDTTQSHTEPETIRPELFKITTGEEFHRTRESGTLDWVFSNTQLREFHKSTENEILWFAAEAGCGKSVSTKSIVNEHVLDVVDGLTLSCFIVNNGSKRGKIATALQALLDQIFTARPALWYLYAADLLMRVGVKVMNDETALWDIFTKVISDPAIGKELVCLIDGFDECDDPFWFVENLKQLWTDIECSEQDTRPILKLFVTSAPHIEFEKLFSEIQGVRLIWGPDYVEHIKLDLRVLYRTRLERLGCSSSDRLKIDRSFRKLRPETANYLWFDLYWPEIEKRVRGQDGAERTRFLSAMPRSLDLLYGRLLKDREDTNGVLRVFRTVLGAMEPLTLTELNIALEINSDATSYSDLGLKKSSQFKEYLDQLCGPFFKTVDDRVYFIHHSFKDFLCHTSDPERPTGKFMNRITMEECHMLLGAVCAWILRLEERNSEFSNSAKRLKTSLESQRGTEFTHEYVSSMPFLHYAATYWHEHFRLSPRHTPEMNEVVKKLCTPQEAGKIPRCLLLSQTRSPEIAELAAEIEELVPREKLTTDASTILVLYIAAWLGLHTLLQHMLSKRWGQKSEPAHSADHPAATLINRAPREGYLTPLGIAAKRDHVASVEVLLKGDAKPLEHDSSPIFSLQLSTDVKWDIIFYCADNLREAGESTAYSRIQELYADQLGVAAASGNYQYVENLLINGPDRNVFNMKAVYGSALYSALETDEPNTDIVLRLLEVGADPNYKEENQETILEIAAHHENPELIKVLIQTGSLPHVHSEIGKRWYEHVGMAGVAKEVGIGKDLDND